jgi:penicillin-binding protein 2
MDFSFRKYVVAAIFVMVWLIFMVRFFYIQVIDNTYKFDATNNSQRLVIQHPARGLIYDRNGKLIVANQAAYDLMVVVGQVSKLDTLVLLDLLDYDYARFMRNYREASRNRFRPFPVVQQMSAQTYVNFQEVMHRFPGFYVQVRSVRHYPYNSAGLLLGYISEVDRRDIDNDSYYVQGDYIGKEGLEKKYELHLRGEKGGEYYVVDVRGRIKGRLHEGKFDKSSVLGKDLVTSLDISLQNYGELLMQNKTGSIVAIEPSTGEVLALISSPNFDPNLLVGQGLVRNYRSLERNPLFPLYNRAIQGDRYPPGSTYKMMNSLIALQEGITTPAATHSCRGGYTAGRIHVRCHPHPNPVNMQQSIQVSCNAYYCTVFRAIIDAPKYGSVGAAYDVWRNHVLSFGLGQPLGIDLYHEKPGSIPSRAYYDRLYGKNRWRSLTIISLAIGQGEIGLTPLQLAHFTAVIANRGHYYIPHIVKSLQDGDIDELYKTRHYATINTKHFDPIIEGMYDVVHGGAGSTARHVAIPGVEMCGKTGTAQNPHGENHAVFMGFAPRDNPKIAIAVYVENAGYGGRWAAPIASLMIEKYLQDSIHPSRKSIEKNMMEANLLNVVRDAN